MAKEFSYRGKSLEQLLALDEAQLLALLPARMRRSLKRNENKRFWKKVKAAAEVARTGKHVKPVKTHRRDTVVLPAMVGLTMAVYNGHEFINVPVTEKMIGHYLGEFALTRKKLTHGKAGIGATKSSTAITARG